MNRLVVCAHGTRSAEGRAAVRRVVRAVAAQTDTPVREAYVDVHGPSLTDVLRPGDTVVPLLLTAGFHTIVDIESAAVGTGRVRVAPPLGPSPLLVDLLVDRLQAAGWQEGDSVVLAAAGSSRAESLAPLEQTRSALAAAIRSDVRLGYGAAREPSVPDAVAAARADGAHRVVVAAYLLAPGHFHGRLLQAGADAVTAPLVAGPDVDGRLVRLVLQRADSSAPPGSGSEDLVRI